MAVVVMPCLLLLPWLGGSWLWLVLSLFPRDVQGINAEQLPSSTLQAQGKLLISGDQDMVTVFICTSHKQEKVCTTRTHARTHMYNTCNNPTLAALGRVRRGS